jgi:hypothetical protein
MPIFALAIIGVVMNLEVPAHIEALGVDYVRLWHEFTIFPTREEVAQKVRIFKARTLANLDSKGRGPGGRQLVGGKVCYPRDQVVIWFAGLSQKQ